MTPEFTPRRGEQSPWSHLSLETIGGRGTRERVADRRTRLRIRLGRLRTGCNTQGPAGASAAKSEGGHIVCKKSFIGPFRVKGTF